MAKSSRAKRKRAAVRSAKRSRNNNWWYVLTALIVVVGVALVVYARATQDAPVGPYVANTIDKSDPHNKDSHWHAALGMYYCDRWLGDTTGTGIWQWTHTNAQNSPSRADQSNVYAGLHSHDDGIIHMEPATNDEAGKHATIGKYFQFGGWDVSSSGYTFVDGDGTKTVKNGDKCGDKPGSLQWAVARFNNDVNAKQKFTVQKAGSDPASWKLTNDDIVVIAFLPEGKNIDSILGSGNPPSLKNLPDASSRESNTPPSSTPAAPPTTGAAPTPTTTKGGATPTTTKP
jgi:hypothetical protein